MWVSNRFNTITRALLDFLLPESCIGCGQGAIILCENCMGKLPPPPKYTEQVISLWSYQDDIVRKAIWTLKYKGNKRLGKIFGGLIYDRALEELSDEKMFHNFRKPLLVPVPLSQKRLHLRGFNQSEVIAREMSLRDGGKTFTLDTSVLYRTRDTESQASIKDRTKRLENMRGCFSVNDARKIAGKNIILIDDVTTTGATLGEAKQVFMDAGAKRVIAFTVAH